MSEQTIAEQVLESWGATAEKLPTSTKEESDWLAVLDGCRLLIEEKTKFTNSDLLVARKAALEGGNPHVTTTRLVRNNRLSGIVRKASSQLESSGAELRHDLRVMWLTSVGCDSEAKQMQFRSTLYGSTKIIEVDGKLFKPCYFFYNSDFFRYGNYLDGAIAAHLVGEKVTMFLCLNPYSENWQLLRDSPFSIKFPNGLIDPLAEESAMEAFVADTDIDRKDPGAVLTYLQNKYRTGRLVNMDMNMASAEILIPRNAP